ncbi:MAG TPA: hypothetical protein VFK20_03380 [Vicinamibacterales bacterium]|nr:hypothetical protein [Vicinamibacterales bacterium]
MRPLREPTLRPGGSDVGRAMCWGLASAAVIIAGIYYGSRRFKDFDPALVSYAGASVFAAFGIGYRYAMWLRRPPTRLYWTRGWQIFVSPRLPQNLIKLAQLFFLNLFAQRFIERRSRLRWSAHWLLAWGCILAAAVTFPLSFGWVRFETPRTTQDIYDAFVFGVHVFSFPIDSALAPLVFNVLDISAAMVLAGVFIALWRRGRDRGALAVQQFGSDLLPLVLLFAVSITGVFLTASTHLFRGYQYTFLSQLHAITVVFTLLYLPFGKFFHIFQRPAQLGVSFYKEAGETGEQARCLRCGAPFASRLHVEDLKRVEAALGIAYQLADGHHYQDVCPACRRKNLAIQQDGEWLHAGRGERVG